MHVGCRWVRRVSIDGLSLKRRRLGPRFERRRERTVGRITEFQDEATDENEGEVADKEVTEVASFEPADVASEDGDAKEVVSSGFPDIADESRDVAREPFIIERGGFALLCRGFLPRPSPAAGFRIANLPLFWRK